MAKYVNMTISGVYQTCKNGGSLSVFGIKCSTSSSSTSASLSKEEEAAKSCDAPDPAKAKKDDQKDYFPK